MGPWHDAKNPSFDMIVGRSLATVHHRVPSFRFFRKKNCENSSWAFSSWDSSAVFSDDSAVLSPWSAACRLRQCQSWLLALWEIRDGFQNNCQGQDLRIPRRIGSPETSWAGSSARIA